MNRTARTVAGLLLMLTALTACGGEAPEPTPVGPTPTTAAGPMKPLETDIATLWRPREWKAVEGPLEENQVAALVITDESGQTVGQMDVLVNQVEPGMQADALDAANQGARFLHFRELRHVRREFADVPGADSAFLNESTYLTAEGEPARSIDLVAIAESGDYILVRISAASSAYDAKTFDTVVESVRLTTEADS